MLLQNAASDQGIILILIQFIFVHVSLASYATFDLPLIIHHLSFNRCPEKNVLRDCVIPWAFSIFPHVGSSEDDTQPTTFTFKANENFAKFLVISSKEDKPIT